MRNRVAAVGVGVVLGLCLVLGMGLLVSLMAPPFGYKARALPGWSGSSPVPNMALALARQSSIEQLGVGDVVLTTDRHELGQVVAKEPQEDGRIVITYQQRGGEVVSWVAGGDAEVEVAPVLLPYLGYGSLLALTWPGRMVLLPVLAGAIVWSRRSAWRVPTRRRSTNAARVGRVAQSATGAASTEEPVPAPPEDPLLASLRAVSASPPALDLEEADVSVQPAAVGEAPGGEAPAGNDAERLDNETGHDVGWMEATAAAGDNQDDASTEAQVSEAGSGQGSGETAAAGLAEQKPLESDLLAIFQRVEREVGPRVVSGDIEDVEVSDLLKEARSLLDAI